MSYNLIVNINSIMHNTGLTDSGDVINSFIKWSNVIKGAYWANLCAALTNRQILFL